MKSKRTTIATNGMDVIVLRRDMTFDEQMTLNNAIYVIKYVFDLNNETTILPDNCVLKFIGGKLQNGIIGLNNAKIEACGEIFGEGLSFIGKIQNEASPEWFEVVDEQNSNDSSSDSIKIERSINAFSSIKLASRDYVIDRPINIRKSCFIKGNSFACFFSAEESDSSRTRLIATNHIPCILNINMDYDNNIPNEKNTDESIELYKSTEVWRDFFISGINSGCLIGDVDNSGLIDVSDVVELADFVMGGLPEQFYKIVADVNEDGIIDVTDVVLTANRAMGD
ncbi:MAG: dockerin type I repeat-containing protein [Muribaculaceae bacterium]|nr:dockerin type I repeat-containing protein [Muribaculaceae bacterium]